MPRIRFGPLAVLGLLLTAFAATPVRAEVRVQGSAQDIRLEANQATIADILAALRTRYALRVRGIEPNRVITGVYQGSLRAILARVLEGYDYVIVADGPAMEVRLVSDQAPRVALPAARPAAPPAVVRRRED